MTTKDLATLANFVAQHSIAWIQFQQNASEEFFTGFSFNADKGSWELIDGNGASHFFREHLGQIVAIVSSLGSYVIVNENIIKI